METKTLLEYMLYIVLFGGVIIYLLLKLIKHGGNLFKLGMENLDDYVINYELSAETFAESIPSTPKLSAKNSSFGSSIYFKVAEDHADVEGYICTIKNTSDNTEAMTVKILPKTQKDSSNMIYEEIVLKNKGDIYQVHIKPFTKKTGEKGEATYGVPSNPVYIFSKSPEEGRMIESTLSWRAKDIDDLNFMDF